jgi:hypothetical protein
MSRLPRPPSVVVAPKPKPSPPRIFGLAKALAPLCNQGSALTVPICANLSKLIYLTDNIYYSIILIALIIDLIVT